ncbi:MAG TPA: hypothetical protein VMW27_18595 [Thermoanaerobaculia bacterium]|nr:hypothetical protein [Thermoanaerobaculia bacterium]
MTVPPRPRFWMLRLLLGVLTLFLAVSLRAQEVEPPRFLLETITVTGPRPAAANIVRAESLLEEGRSYTEDELRQAVYRIKRIPFVLDADFALHRGSERGAYELEIQVQQARKLFFDQSLGLFVFQDPLALDSSVAEDAYGQLEGLIGLRQFIGRSGVLFGALDTVEGLQVGYTHYDLFGRGIVASAAFSGRAFCCQYLALSYGLDPSFVSWDFGSSTRASLHLSIPLSVEHSLQMGASERRGDAGSRGEILNGGRNYLDTWQEFSEGDLTYRTIEAKWNWDTTDHPLVPTRGFAVSAGIEAGDFSAQHLIGVRYDPGTPGVPFSVPSYEAQEVNLVGAAVRHWPVTAKQTVSLNGRVSAGQSRIDSFRRADGTVLDADLDLYSGSVGARHSWDIWRTRKANDYVDHRFETTVEIGTEAFSSDVDLGVDTSPLQRFEASIAYIFRNQWGQLRFHLSYLDLGEVYQ